MICDKLLARSTVQAKQNVETKRLGASFLRGDLRRGGRNDQDPVVRRHSGLVDGVLPRRTRGERDIHSHSGAQDAGSASKSPYQGNGSRGIGFHSVALIKRVIVGRGFV